MEFEVLIPYLLVLYDKAKDSFKECIYNKDNQFLKNEVDIPLENIITIEKDVKIVFSKKVFNHYLFEVTLLLFDENKEIGKYLYFENEKKEVIDDSLIFY